MLFPTSFYRPVRLLLFFFVFTTAITASGQRFYSVVFDQLPQSYQVYPRNDKNEANVPVSGRIEVEGYSHMSVLVSRNAVPIRYLRAPIRYGANGIGTFSTSTTIKAELANYTFDVYACKTTDSVLMTKREKVVSGDALVIMGQSNSTGGFGETETSEFCRTFGALTGTLNIEHYNHADTLWSLSNTSYKTNVGTMGLEIQKQLVQQSGVPICLINAGFHWSSAYLHSVRSEDNPMDLSTAYGRMLYRVTKAGIKSVTKAFVYRQGETEAYHEGGDWDKYFDVFYKNLKKDLPALRKMYVFQIDVIYYPSLTGAILRDYQRRLPEIYPDVRNLATVGTKEFDGIHYGKAGNVQGGYEVSRLINRDLYAYQDTLNIDSPNVRKAFYKTAERKELVLVFDEGQQLYYPQAYKPNANVTLEMKDFFYLNGKEGLVASGSAAENRVELKLNAAPDGNTISYLPPYVREGGSYYPFTGPYIKNAKEMRAFSFYQVPIVEALPVSVLTAVGNEATVELAWSGVAGAASYQLDRKRQGDLTWTKLVTLTSDKLSYSDGTVGQGPVYNFRIKGISPNSESAEFGYADAGIRVVTGIEEDKRSPVFALYPNPLPSRSMLTIHLSRPVAGGKLTFYDLLGRKQYEVVLLRPAESFRIETATLNPDFYLVELESEEMRLVRKLVVLP